ncbi:class I SAM-dependent methyltransferase [Altererythrobacter arenosus]|uniref:Class I SAM-dependent methyltransferase n=1 Tax=Altererythrobacter arenosus TaxID=3032592 RepID=A0ABY8FR72_9SPHN|nr:class I SAM-dependent methyltransferase [Altererythrobacter sp. CAU 1644]WFL76735.1 class I SAM-dependent methyltransferase [Altererythrobacter sp. CAU 1644]
MPGIEDWQGQVGETWASEWLRTDRSFSNLTPQLVDRVLRREFTHALDIGCGAGELSIRVAGARPEAQVLGVDVNESLIATARERAGGSSNLAFEIHDAGRWTPPEEARPQSLFSRHGVMFFDDPVAAFENLRAAASPLGAALTFSCFRSLSDNPFFTQIGALLPKGEDLADPTAPGPFAFADRDRVASILTDAGWRDIEFERIDFEMIAGAGVDPVGDACAYFNRIGPAARALAGMPEEERPPIRAKIAELAASNLRDGKVAMMASVWIVTASTN